MVTDCGKLQSARLFAICSHYPPANLPCGRAVVWCLVSGERWQNYVLQRAKQCLGTNPER